jgi:hypothetical protein
MANVKGRGVRVEIAQTFGSPKTVTNVTNAKPPVVTSVAHGLAAKAIGFFSGLAGMVQLEGQAARVDTVLTDTFAVLGLNSTNYSSFGAGTATFTPVTAWVTLAEATSYDIGGGASAKLNATRLIDVVNVQESGLLAAQTMAYNILAQTSPSVAMGLVQDAAQLGANLLFRITLDDGAQRICYGEPSLPGESVGQGALGTGTMTVDVKGFVLQIAP